MLSVDQTQLWDKLQGFDIPFNEVFMKILLERVNQLKKFQEGEVPKNLAFLGDGDRLVFLTEELGEIARGIRDRHFQPITSIRFIPDQIEYDRYMENELMQLATHTVTWLSSI